MVGAHLTQDDYKSVYPAHKSRQSAKGPNHTDKRQTPQQGHAVSKLKAFHNFSKFFTVSFDYFMKDCSGRLRQHRPKVASSINSPTVPSNSYTQKNLATNLNSAFGQQKHSRPRDASMSSRSVVQHQQHLALLVRIPYLGGRRQYSSLRVHKVNAYCRAVQRSATLATRIVYGRPAWDSRHARVTTTWLRRRHKHSVTVVRVTSHSNGAACQRALLTSDCGCGQTVCSSTRRKPRSCGMRQLIGSTRIPMTRGWWARTSFHLSSLSGILVFTLIQICR
jgi:hypothetical protein